MFFSYKATTNLLYILASAIPIGFFIILICKRKFKTLFISIILVLSLCTYVFVFVSNFKDTTYDNTSFVISGKIFYYTTLDDDVCYLGVTGVKLVGGDSKVKSLPGNLFAKIELNDNATFVEGASVYFSSKIYGLSATNSEGRLNTYYVKNNFKYTTSGTISSSNIFQVENSPSWDVRLKTYNKNLLVDTLGEVNGNVAFSLLYGDRRDVPDDLISIFSTSGVMHVFAISGLHVGIIVAILYFILKKCGIRDEVSFFVELIFLALYSFLCAFSPSVLRASFMSLCFLSSKIVGRKNDLLSTLSFAGIVLLVINPMQLFYVGFQMSFASVLGIAMFGDLFLRLKIKNKVVSYVTCLLCTSLATQLMLLPIFASNYGFVATWSIVANLITLPLFSVFYPILFVANLVSLFLPFLSFILHVPNLVLQLIICLNGLVASLPFAVINLKSTSMLFTFLYYFLLFLVGRYTNKALVLRRAKNLQKPT